MKTRHVPNRAVPGSVAWQEACFTSMYDSISNGPYYQRGFSWCSCADGSGGHSVGLQVVRGCFVMNQSASRTGY